MIDIVGAQAAKEDDADIMVNLTHVSKDKDVHVFLTRAGALRLSLSLLEAIIGRTKW